MKTRLLTADYTDSPTGSFKSQHRLSKSHYNNKRISPFCVVCVGRGGGRCNAYNVVHNYFHLLLYIPFVWASSFECGGFYSTAAL